MHRKRKGRSAPLKTHFHPVRVRACSTKTKTCSWLLASEELMSNKSVGYSKFCDLWTQLCPFNVIMTPATALRWTCQKNNDQSKMSKFTRCSKGRSSKAARKPFEPCCREEGPLQKLLQNNERYPNRTLKKHWIFRETSTLWFWRNSPLRVWLCPTASLSCRPLSARQHSSFSSTSLSCAIWNL